jgi:hypothetical protein
MGKFLETLMGALEVKHLLGNENFRSTASLQAWGLPGFYAAD